MDTSALLFIGALQSSEDCRHNPDCSEAMNRDQLILLRGLSELGVGPIHAISVLPIARYPRSRKRYIPRQTQQLDADTGFGLTYAPFVNWGILKPPTTLAGCLLEVMQLYHDGTCHPRWILIVNPMVRTAPAAFLARTLWKAPIVGLVADSDPVQPGWRGYTMPREVRNRLRLAAVRRCDAWIVFSSKLASELPGDRPRMVIWSGLAEDIVELQRTPADKQPSRNVLYSGNLRVEDGVEMLLDAFPQLPTNDVELRICGRGPLAAEVEHRARIDTRIHFYGWVSGDRYKQLLAEATVAVNPRLGAYPENHFNFPSKLLEYLGAGCPTISTLTGDVEQQFGPCIYHLREETSKALVGKLEEVLALPSFEREAMGARARACVLENHTWRAQVQWVHDFLLSLTAETSAWTPSPGRRFTASNQT